MPKSTNVSGTASPPKKRVKKRPDPKPKAPVPKSQRKIDGLKKPQVRILEALSDGNWLSRAEIATKAKVDNASLTGYLGSMDVETREKNDTEWYMSLISLKFVKTKVTDENGKDVPRFAISALGKSKIK